MFERHRQRVLGRQGEVTWREYFARYLLFRGHRQRVLHTQGPVSWTDYFRDPGVRWWTFVIIISAVGGLIGLARNGLP